MTDKSKNKNYKPIAFKGHAFIATWSLITIIVFVLIGYNTILLISQIKLEENALYQINYSNEYVDLEGGSFQDARSIENSTEVLVGVYIDHIRELNIKDLIWIVDFYIWFAWNDKNANPGDNFQIINGYIDNNDKTLQYWRQNKAGLRYEQYNVVASIAQNFDVRLYPFDTQYLMIRIEDTLDQIDKLKYIPDAKNSTLSDRVNITGIKIIDRPRAIVRLAEYKTNFGDPFKNRNWSIYSQFCFIIPVQRDDPLLLFIKLFQGLIVAVFVSLLAFFIKPTLVDPRFGLGIGGLFAAVANNYIISATLPVAGCITLVGLIHGIGITIIFYTLVQSILSLYIYDRLDERTLSELFDKVSFMIIMIIFSIIIIGIIRVSL